MRSTELYSIKTGSHRTAQKKAVRRVLRTPLLGECCYAALLRWEGSQPSVTAHVCRRLRRRAMILLRHAKNRHRVREPLRRDCSARNVHHHRRNSAVRHRNLGLNVHPRTHRLHRTSAA